jgi:hypothetical protein
MCTCKSSRLEETWRDRFHEVIGAVKSVDDCRLYSTSGYIDSKFIRVSEKRTQPDK